MIADEPTTALDVTVQAQILNLMTDLQKEMGMSIILITHDLGVIAETCDEVVVMYAGRVVERAPVKELFANPLHAYTRGLLHSIPRLDGERKTRLNTIEGNVPALKDMPDGCRFGARSGHRAHSRRTRRAPAARGGVPRPLGRDLPEVLPARMSKLLEIKNLKMHFPVKGGVLLRAVDTCKAVDGVSRSTSRRARPSGWSGESGCGKSTLGKCVVRLNEPTAGEVQLRGAGHHPRAAAGRSCRCGATCR